MGLERLSDEEIRVVGLHRVAPLRGCSTPFRLQPDRLFALVYVPSRV